MRACRVEVGARGRHTAPLARCAATVAGVRAEAPRPASSPRTRAPRRDLRRPPAGVSTDDTFRDIKDVNALASTATDQIAALADKKKLEVEAA